MKLKDKIQTWWSKLTVKTVNRTFGIVIFVLVFLFTFLFGFEFKEQWKLLLEIFCPIIGAVGIAWLVIALIVYKRNKINDPNQQKIKQALDNESKKDKI